MLLPLKFRETIQLPVSRGLRKFQAHVRSPHFSCCFCPQAGLLYHLSLRDEVQPRLSELYFLFVGPLGLRSGTSHKLLRGPARVAGRGRGDPVLAPCSVTDDRTAREQTLYLSISLSLYFFRLWGKMNLHFVKYLGSLHLI